jgi:hypothetical protein
MTHASLNLALAEAVRMIGDGHRLDESPADFAARVIEQVGARAYSLVIARVQSGTYPDPDGTLWADWAPQEISRLRTGISTSGVVTYACGAALGEGFARCGFQRGHIGTHGENY